MSNKTNTKIRLVKCPRCRQILPELPEVPLYECGGCGVRLQAKKPKNGTMDEPSQKMKQPFDNTETGSTSNQQFHQNKSDDHHEQRSSTELSCHQDPESSPDIDEEHHIRDDIDVEETDNGVIKDSNGGSKSNFKSLIAEKLLDTSLRKASSGGGSRLDEDDSLSEYESANLSLRKSGRGFERVSSFETLENVGFGNTSYYGYEGSESSFDEKADLRSRKNHFGYKGLMKSDKWRHEHQPIDVQSVYGNPGPSRGDFDEFDGNSRYRSSLVGENPKLEKLELLKMVQKLQDQLDRTTVSNAQQVPSYQVPNHPRYPGRYGQRMAFSGNAAPLDGNRVMSPCHHCCPQERPFSAQLPSQAICYHHGHYGAPYVNPGPYHSPRFSSHSSPQRSEFSVLSHETKTVDFRQAYLPEKHRSPRKRHVRPIGGGAPLITCYRCLKLLQMPQSFLLFKRRYHSLKCGACSKMLKFTVSNGSRVARYFPEETITAPPSSEAGDYPGSSRVGPVSCSDSSFPKSYSTESFQVRTFDWNSSEQKMSSSEFPAKKKVVSEIEEIEPPSSAPPLHRLMGYTSPSKVIHS